MKKFMLRVMPVIFVVVLVACNCVYAAGIPAITDFAQKIYPCPLSAYLLLKNSNFRFHILLGNCQSHPPEVFSFYPEIHSANSYMCNLIVFYSLIITYFVNFLY